jgi:hypothetical protein
VQLSNFSQAQSCLYADINCLSSLVNLYGEPIDAIVLSQEDGLMPINITPLYRSLSDSQGYKLVYANEEVKIFERQP